MVSMCWERSSTPSSGCRSFRAERGPGALVGERGRHADVEDDQVGTGLVHRDLQQLGVTERGDDVVAAVEQEPGEALAQEHLVLDDHDAHGSLAVNVVPRPRRCRSAASRRRDDPIGQPGETGAGPGRAPPMPSSATAR